MAVTKRTRFEILRRDNHTCQYCGAKAPDAVLQIDHVIPVSLGGDDKPGNLLTACKDCNSGKTSIMPDSPVVESLSDRAAAYVLGMTDKMTRFRQGLDDLDRYRDSFLAIWRCWVSDSPDGETEVPLPEDYELKLLGWLRAGVPMRALQLAVTKAMNKAGLRGEFGAFQYAAGVVTGMLDAYEIDLTLTEETAATYTEKEAARLAGNARWQGHDDGKAWARNKAVCLDPLRNHIDGTVAVEDKWTGTWKVERVGAG